MASVLSTGPPSFGPPALKGNAPSPAFLPPAVTKGGSKRPSRLRDPASESGDDCGRGGRNPQEDYVDEFQRLREREEEIKDLADRLGDLLGDDEEAQRTAAEELNLDAPRCAEVSFSTGTSLDHGVRFDFDFAKDVSLKPTLPTIIDDDLETRADQAEKVVKDLRREMEQRAAQVEEERRGFLEQWNRDIESLKAAQASELHALQQARQLGQFLQERDAEILELRARVAELSKEPRAKVASTLNLQKAAQQSELQALQHCQQLSQQLSRRDTEVAELRRELSQQALSTASPCPVCAARRVADAAREAEVAPPLKQKDIWPSLFHGNASTAVIASEEPSDIKAPALATPPAPFVSSDLPEQEDAGLRLMQQAHACVVDERDEAAASPSLAASTLSTAARTTSPDTNALTVSPRGVQSMPMSSAAAKSPGSDVGARPISVRGTLPSLGNSSRSDSAAHAEERRPVSPLQRRPVSPVQRRPPSPSRLVSPLLGVRAVQAIVLPSNTTESLERRPVSPVQRHRSVHGALFAALPGTTPVPQQPPPATPPQVGSPQVSSRSTLPLSFASSPFMVMRAVNMPSRSRSSPHAVSGRDLHSVESRR